MTRRSPTHSPQHQPQRASQQGILQRQCRSCGQHTVAGHNCPTCTQPQTLLRRQAVNHGSSRAVPSVVKDVLRSPGQPLNESVRPPLESSFSHDFSRVRIHTSARAAAAAAAVDALAYTVGQHVVFGYGQYRPQSSGGQRLLAHELAHVVQHDQADSPALASAPLHLEQEVNTAAEREADQAAARVTGGHPAQISQGLSASALSKQSVPAPSQTGASTATGVTAQDIFPFAPGGQVVLTRILSDLFFRILSSQDPATAAALEAIDRQVATVTTATDDLFEASLTGTVTIPARGDSPARTLTNIVLRLQRNAGGQFDFVLAATEAGQATTLMEQIGLTASRGSSGAITLSSGSGPTLQPQLLVAPSGADAVELSVFTAPLLSEVPQSLRSMVPERVEAIAITQLPAATTAPADVESAVERIAARASGSRSVRRQQFGFGVGAQFGADEDVAPLLSAAWQIRFPTTGILGAFGVPEPARIAAGESVFIPLDIRLQYAPTLPEFRQSVLGGVTTGIGVSLAAIEVPVNLVILTGVAGGGVQVPTATGPEFGSAFGIPLGLEAGLELDTLRINLRYEHLFNLLEGSPNIDSLFINIGPRF